MNTAVDLPALRSDDTLGFLAALGVLELCTHGLGWEVRLGWRDGHAVLDCPVPDAATVARELGALARSLDEQALLVPAGDPKLIPKALGTAERRSMEEKTALDPLKMGVQEAVRRFAVTQRKEVQTGESTDARWLTALVCQCGPARRGEADERRLTPMYAASGQMTVNQLFRDALRDVVKRPARIEEALVRWRRERGTGANLDARALIDAVQASGGLSDNQAVLGAAWLALQSFPWFVQVGNGQQADALGWVRRRGASDLVWPIWSPLLDLPAVRVLLGHPTVAGAVTEAARTNRPGGEQASDRASRDLRSLGVLAIHRAARRGLSKSAGPLETPSLVWAAR